MGCCCLQAGTGGAWAMGHQGGGQPRAGWAVHTADIAMSDRPCLCLACRPRPCLPTRPYHGQESALTGLGFKVTLLPIWGLELC